MLNHKGTDNTKVHKEDEIFECRMFRVLTSYITHRTCLVFVAQNKKVIYH